MTAPARAAAAARGGGHRRRRRRGGGPRGGRDALARRDGGGVLLQLGDLVLDVVAVAGVRRQLQVAPVEADRLRRPVAQPVRLRDVEEHRGVVPDLVDLLVLVDRVVEAADVVGARRPLVVLLHLLLLLRRGRRACARAAARPTDSATASAAAATTAPELSLRSRGIPKREPYYRRSSDVTRPRGEAPIAGPLQWCNFRALGCSPCPGRPALLFRFVARPLAHARPGGSDAPSTCLIQPRRPAAAGCRLPFGRPVPRDILQHGESRRSQDLLRPAQDPARRSGFHRDQGRHQRPDRRRERRSCGSR